MSEEYYVKLTGNLAGGRTPDIAANLLSKLFRIPLEKGRQMFQGKPTLLRKKLDKETAEKIVHLIRNAGAECGIEPVEDAFSLTLELIDDAPNPSPSLELVEESQETSEIILEPVADEGPPSLELELVSMSSQDDGPVEKPKIEEAEPETEKEELFSLSLEPADEPPTPKPAAPPPLPVEEAGGLDQQAGEDIPIGDVAQGQGASSHTGGMLPQASTAPVFRRPLQEGMEEKSGNSKKLLPLALLLVLLGAGAWYMFFSEPEVPPPPKVVKKAVVPVKPDELPPSALNPTRKWDIDETQVKLKVMAQSIRTWQLEFGNGALPAQDLVRVRADMGISDADLTDAWGSPIQFQPGEGGFSLASPGPDKVAGTEDDIRIDATP